MGVINDNFIIECGRCGISLTKGDGCDAIVCVCRNNICWSTEKKNSIQIMNFCRDYPHNTTDECARLMYAVSHRPGIDVNLVLQREAGATEYGNWKDKLDAIYAYRNKYIDDVNSRLIDLWKYHNSYESCVAAMNHELSSRGPHCYFFRGWEH